MTETGHTILVPAGGVARLGRSLRRIITVASAAVVCVASAMPGGRTRAAPPAAPPPTPTPAASSRTLWLEGGAFDPGALDVDRLTAGNAVRRIIIPWFVDGQTLVPVPGTPFPQMAQARGRSAALRRFVAEARRRGVAVYGFVDCLHWRPAGVSPDVQDILARSPEWMERDLEGNCGLPTDGAYASPFSADVRRSLRSVFEYAGTDWPELEGLVVQCRLPYGTILGYSNAARTAYIAARHLDPMDIRLTGPVEEMRITAAWIDWRLAAVTKLVRELCAGYRSKRPGGRIAVVGYANLYRLRPGVRNTLLEDWLDWSRTGQVDEVLLEAEWGRPDNAKSFEAATTLMTKAADRGARGRKSGPARSVRATLLFTTTVLPVGVSPLPGSVALRVGDGPGLRAVGTFWDRLTGRAAP